MIWRKFLRNLTAVVVALGCASIAIAAAPTPGMAPGPTAPALSELLAGEFALQSGQLDEAARHYELADRLAADPAVAERALRVALMAGDFPRADRALARWQAIAPDSVRRAGFALQLHLGRGRVGPALVQARQLLATPEGWRNVLAALSARGEDADTAHEVLRGIVDDRGWPAAVEPSLAFAGLARRFDDAALARRIVDRLLAASPDDPRVLVAAAMLDKEAGQPAAARGRLDRALKGDLTPEVRRALAGELRELGDPVAAAGALAAGPQDDTTYMLRAAWLAQAKDLAALAALDTELQAGEPTPARRLLLGQLAELRGAWADAERWYRSVPSGPARERARLRIAVALEKQDRADDAIAWLRTLEEDNEFPAESRRDAYLAEAEAWARRSNDPEAMAAFARGLARFVDDPVLLYGRAMQHVRRQRADDGLADLKRILDRDGDHAEALNAYGYTLAEYKRRYAEALDFVEKSNRLQPNSSATLDSLGFIRMKLGQPDKALPLLRQAWSLGEDPEIAAHLGEVLWLEGQRDEARRIWARGRELEPDNRALRAIQEQYGQ